MAEIFTKMRFFNLTYDPGDLRKNEVLTKQNQRNVIFFVYFLTSFSITFRLVLGDPNSIDEPPGVFGLLFAIVYSI